MGDILSRKRWVVAGCDKDRAADIAENCEIEPFAAYLLCARGMTDEFEVESFLYDTDLIDPFTLPDMDKACERVLRALENGEKISVDSLYYEMKERYAIAILIDMIDEKIEDKVLCPALLRCFYWSSQFVPACQQFG